MTLSTAMKEGLFARIELSVADVTVMVKLWFSAASIPINFQILHSETRKDPSLKG